MTLEPIRVVVAFHSTFYTPVHVADRLGSFREEGLAATLIVPPPGGTVELIQRGEADVALSGVMRSFVLADRGGADLIAIAEVNSRDGFFLLGRERAERFTWRDLEGKRLALFGLAPTPWMCLQAVLRREGVDPGKVQLLEGLDPEAGATALRRGEADYLQTGQPLAEDLLAQGAAFLVAAQAPHVGHVPYSSFIVTREVRDTRPDLCARAVRALTRALRWMATQPGEAIADLIAPDFPEIDPSVLRTVLVRYHRAGTWANGPTQDRTAFDRLGRALVTGGLIRAAAPYDALVDDTFALAAVGALGETR